MYEVNGRPPMATSTRRAASFGVTVTSRAPAPVVNDTRPATSAMATSTADAALPARLVMRARAERRRDLESLAVALLPVEQLVGVLVVRELLGLAVESQLAPDAVRDVAEMRQRRGQMSFEDVAREDLRIARADRVDEVLIVRILRRRQPGRTLVRIRQVGARSFFVLRPEVRLPFLA